MIHIFSIDHEPTLIVNYETERQINNSTSAGYRPATSQHCYFITHQFKHLAWQFLTLVGVVAQLTIHASTERKHSAILQQDSLLLSARTNKKAVLLQGNHAMLCNAKYFYFKPKI